MKTQSYLAVFATCLALTACGGGSSGGSSDNDQPDNTGGDNTGGDNTSGSSTGTLSDGTWSAGQDAIIGLGFAGSQSAPEISVLKGTLQGPETGDLYTMLSATYPATDLTAYHTIDMQNDILDFEDMETFSLNGLTYTVMCKEGYSTTPYDRPTLLRIFTNEDPAAFVDIDVAGTNGPINYEMRGCNSIAVRNAGGDTDSTSILVYVAGYSMEISGSSTLMSGDRIVEVELTVDGNADVDAAGAVTASVNNIQEYFADNLSTVAVTEEGDVYFSRVRGFNNQNCLMHVNPESGAGIAVVECTGDDVFAGDIGPMRILDMVAVDGATATDFDKIYMVSNFDYPGIVVSEYRTDLQQGLGMELSANADTDTCSDVLTVGTTDDGVTLWCYDSTDSGKILAVGAP